MHRSVEEILKDILNLPLESGEILITGINKMLPDNHSVNASIIEFRKDIQEKIRFACPQCSGEVIQQNFSEADYLFPIPENDIRLNPSLTQNPGYN